MQADIMLQLCEILLVNFFIFVVSEPSSSKVNILHVYSIDYVTTEPHEVVKKGVEWLNKNFISTNNKFTVQSLVHNKVTIVHHFYKCIYGNDFL